MKDYKQTLNLPSTDFPMKANLVAREPQTLAFWQEIDLYAALREKHASSPTFIVHDGPPYANGPIHLGHSLNKILKDTVVKYRSLRGYNAPLVPGWDCHGLPIELMVEKKVGKPGVRCEPDAFRDHCRRYAQSQVSQQRSDFQRLGVIADWEHPYLTLNFDYESQAVRTLASFVERGYLKKGEKPVHWCVECGSALADTEVEYAEKTSAAIDVAFVVTHMAEHFCLPAPYDRHRVVVPIWTTTPWTLPANQAVCVNESLMYGLFADPDQPLLYMLAVDLAPASLARYQVPHQDPIMTFTGATLRSWVLQHPFIDRQVPVLMGAHVTTEAGTGCVHTAPAHGLDDYHVGHAAGLDCAPCMNDRSVFHTDVPVVGGLHVRQCQTPILEALQQAQALLACEDLLHSYPHCWRHHTPLIFKATAQWFIDLSANALREKALAAIDQVDWLPAWGQRRIRTMVESRPDWCLSRQRYWGIPMPLFIHQQTAALHPQTVPIMRRVADVIAQEGLAGWFASPDERFLDDASGDYRRVTDTCDVWFDSGVSHVCVLAQQEHLRYPADLVIEGSDQHRGWFQTSLLTAVMQHGSAPYRQVLTHGYVVDGQGLKMSKSVGNTITPPQVIQKYGADILRLWVASTDFKDDVRYSDEIIKRITDGYRRIRNTARFLLANLFDFDPQQHQVAPDQLLELDAWLIDAAQKRQQHIEQAYDVYDLASVYQAIHHFCSQECGSFYLDVIKDRQYTSATDSLPRRSAQTAMYHLLEGLVRWMAPILSFTAEEIWQHMPQRSTQSVFLSDWYQAWPKGAAVGVDWAAIMQLRDEANKVVEQARRSGIIGSALDATIVIYADETLRALLQPLGDELRFVFIASQVRVKSLVQASELASATAQEGLRVEVLPCADQKCERCWQRRQSVGSDPQHPQLCVRCVDNVSGVGEVRCYA